MIVRSVLLLTILALLGACGLGADRTGDGSFETTTEVAASDMEPTSAAELGALVCRPQTGTMPIAGRESPYDSASVPLGDVEAKVCYGRPSMRGRQIFGGLIPYDTLWRTGANEPTTLHLPVAADIAGIPVGPGAYSLYTVPGQTQWTVIVNRSTDQWGIESRYTEPVRAQEVARAHVPVESLEDPVEMFTIAAEPSGDDASNLVLEWDRTKVLIPIRRR